MVELMGLFLWSMVLITGVYSYTGVKYSPPDTLKDLCDNFSPHKLSDSTLEGLLADLNALRFSEDNLDFATKSNNLKWISSCVGGVMMEVKSRSFEQKLTQPQIEGLGKK